MISTTFRLLIPLLLIITLLISGTGHGQEIMDCDENNNCMLMEMGSREGESEERKRLTQEVDPNLEPGFPVKAYHSSGTYHSGPSIHTLVGNIDDDPELEIVITGLARGPLYAWNHDGTNVTGWPVGSLGANYPALGNFSGNPEELEVFTGRWDSVLAAYSGSGEFLGGWPKDAWNFVTTPPSTADVNGDGLDEVFIGEESWNLHAYRSDGSVLTGWPVRGDGGQERHTPAIADLDGDGDLEIIVASGSSTSGVYMFAYHHDGSTVAGFPFVFDGSVDTFPAIGDVDGDEDLEIVFANRTGIFIYSTTGVYERWIPTESYSPYGSAPALADLDGDGIPEIVRQANEALSVVRGDGSTYPGWPAPFPGDWQGESAPVVGDVNGDQLPEVVITTHDAGTSAIGEVRVYDRNGSLLPGFPKVLPIGSGGVPAIADIDKDGRNEIIITGSYWNGYSGFYDKVWVYDLGGPAHGAIEWGQFMGDPRHQGVYRPSGYRWKMIFPFVVGSEDDGVPDEDD